MREESRVFHQDLLSPLGVGAESGERSPRVVCCRAGFRTRDWIWKREEK